MRRIMGGSRTARGYCARQEWEFCRKENSGRAQARRRLPGTYRVVGLFVLTKTPQVVPSPVFPVSLVVVPTVPVRLPSVTCAVPVACSPLPRSGASGTSRSIWARSMFSVSCTRLEEEGKKNTDQISGATLLPLPWLPLPSLPSCSPVATASPTLSRFPSSSTLMPSRAPLSPRPLPPPVS